MWPACSSELPGTWVSSLKALWLWGEDYIHLWEGLETTWGVSITGCFWEDRRKSLGERVLGMFAALLLATPAAVLGTENQDQDPVSLGQLLAGWPCHCRLSGHLTGGSEHSHIQSKTTTVFFLSEWQVESKQLWEGQGAFVSVFPLWNEANNVPHFPKSWFFIYSAPIEK